MRYHVTIGKGEGAAQRLVRFDETPQGLVAHVTDSGAATSRTRDVPVDACSLERGKGVHLIVGEESHDFYLEPIPGGYEVHYRGQRLTAEVVDERELLARSLHSASPAGPREIRAPMPGVIVAVEVETGQEVAGGQTLLVVEAMKMQNPITAQGGGEVAGVHVEAGQTVAAGDLLVTLG